LARQLVRAYPLHLFRGELRRHLLELADELGDVREEVDVLDAHLRGLACRRVALPTQRTSRPVARGSSVPVCPTFLIFERRRNFSTASWLVMPAFLSTRRSPSTRGGSGRGMARNDTSLEDVFEQRHHALAQRTDERERGELDQPHHDVERGVGEPPRFPLPRRLVVDPEEDQAELVEPEEPGQKLFEVFGHFGPGQGVAEVIDALL